MNMNQALSMNGKSEPKTSAYHSTPAYHSPRCRHQTRLTDHLLCPILAHFNQIPQSVGIDQACCIIGNHVKHLCKKNKTDLFFEPAKNPRTISLVD